MFSFGDRARLSPIKCDYYWLLSLFNERRRPYRLGGVIRAGSVGIVVALFGHMARGARGAVCGAGVSAAPQWRAAVPNARVASDARAPRAISHLPSDAATAVLRPALPAGPATTTR
ncbi:unnamed protein product [Pieris brassicae]|uniref:Uncharacterized protein n=1 Tax=Pieris brassicae TaxID=7116 RepID=A0A9P0TA80_PIEBR|nr:unnamed protein product [Pieris brassicae]